MPSQAPAALGPSLFHLRSLANISRQNQPAEPFLTSWLAETREDNKMIVVLSQRFSWGEGGMICFAAVVTRIWVHWLRIGHLNGVGMEAGGGAGEWGREVHISVFPIFTIFPQGSSASTSGYQAVFFTPPIWLPSMRKSLPSTGWEPLLYV